jgi:hypothetical protein
VYVDRVGGMVHITVSNSIHITQACDGRAPAEYRAYQMNGIRATHVKLNELVSAECNAIKADDQLTLLASNVVQRESRYYLNVELR